MEAGRRVGELARPEGRRETGRFPSKRLASLRNLISAMPAPQFLTTVCFQVSVRPSESTPVPVPTKTQFCGGRWYSWLGFRKVLRHASSSEKRTSLYKWIPSILRPQSALFKRTLLLNLTDGNRGPQSEVRQPPDPETFGSLGCAKDPSDKTEPQNSAGVEEWSQVASLTTPDPGRHLPLSPRPLAHLNAEGCHPAHGSFANSHQPPRSLAPIGRGRPRGLGISSQGAGPGGRVGRRAGRAEGGVGRGGRGGGGEGAGRGGGGAWRGRGEEREGRRGAGGAGGALGISKLGAAGGATPAPGPSRGRRISGAAGRSQWEGWEARTRPRSVGLVGGPAKSRPGVIPCSEDCCAPSTDFPTARTAQAEGQGDPGPDPAPACAPERQGGRRRLGAQRPPGLRGFQHLVLCDPGLFLFLCCSVVESCLILCD